jgi:hypothetical protein
VWIVTLSSIHALPVLVAAVAAFVLGALWYSPALFAKAWVGAHGYTDEQIARMRAGAARSYTISFACFLVMAASMALLVARVQPVGVLGGIKLGALIGLGFAAAVSLTTNVYSDKRFAAWAIDAGYQVVYLTLMGVILTVWH